MGTLIEFNQAYGFWVQTGAIIISIAVTGYFAQKAIVKNGKSAKDTLEHNHLMIRKRATIDILIQENQDKELVEAKRIVMALPGEASFIKYLEPNLCDDDNSKKEKECIRILLNRYEFVALGIKNGAFEEEIYKRLKYSDTMDIWAKAKPMIMELRRQKKRQTYYQEFEWLANRWEKNELTTNQPN
ncbi:DUF4760 domain-containing protein [Neisseria dumasiana]|uniref:DUF4760 domain-containing protein n=1 Tax=Neisseria dumasiana TaxID=1931275 RepID=A0A1X3DJC1_9NEIS|nr:DUF4760 domain-containing protein [Neisseria dumasiana]OSI23541.1 hypothetical protein BV912_03810 [Neisseria dumasiana]OSI35021.1 hypothetical protein BV913_05840 [Neisseria dumasiana]UOO84380.1 DUF4760 domain-containing protein [Neisseria dumasiana]